MPGRAVVRALSRRLWQRPGYDLIAGNLNGPGSGPAPLGLPVRPGLTDRPATPAPPATPATHNSHI
jgi:hypothetical protein